ncbi:MAG: carbohydrate kinase [Bacteroidales bacterium]|nr:carbohydrate kinase [Candidatus Sodaliphilus fimicaballi]
MENYIVGLGEVLFDCLPTGKKLGGAPANFAYHATKCGLRGIAVSAIGHDDDGVEVRTELASHGLQVHLEEVDFPTGVVQVTLDANGVPQYDICPDVAYDNIPWTPDMEHIARNASAVCFGSLAQRQPVSRATILRFLDAMPEDSLKVFDINLRQHWYDRETIESSLHRCDILKLNDEEVSIVASLLDLGEVPVPTHDAPLKPEHFEAVCRTMMQAYGIGLVILTCGARGSYVIADVVSFLPTPEVTVADTVGAGDAFTGAFVAALLCGKPLTQAHEDAVRISAYVCTHPGAMPPYSVDLT